MHRDFRKLSEGRSYKMTFENRLYKAKEAATILACSPKTIYNYILADQLKATNRGKQWYIEGAELERFTKEGTAKGYTDILKAKRKEG